MTLVNFIVIADDDSLISKIEPAFDVDLLICLGDLYDRTLGHAVDHYAPDYAIGIRGNHCQITDFPQPIRDLHLNTMTLKGITFGGFCGGWHYKQQGHYMFTQDEVRELLMGFHPLMFLLPIIHLRVYMKEMPRFIKDLQGS